ncbi:hypothetical protein ABPG72_017710 [Tetrahymena utriculariae]
MKKYFLILTIAIQYLQSKTLEACKKSNAFYDLVQQQCGVCPSICSNCDDLNSCLTCQSQSYYDQRKSQCVSQCQSGDSAQEFYQNCIQCQVQNCDICQFEGIQCKQCRQGWQLSENKMHCQKSECLSNNYSFYDPNQNQCTLNCPEYSDQNERQCSNLRKISQVEAIASRSKVQQREIDYVLFFQEINEKPLIVTLNSQNAILYSYPDLIPLNQIILLNAYVRVAQDSKNIYLLSTLNIQQINLESQIIQISYQVIQAQNVSFSQDSYFFYYNQTLQVYNFVKGIQQNYQILNETIFKFNPTFFSQVSQNTNDTTTSNSPTPNLPSQNSSTISIQKDSQGCTLISQNSSLVKPIWQNVNLIQIDALKESQIIQQNIVNLYQDIYKFSNFQSDMNIVTFNQQINMLQVITSINIYDLNSKNLIASQFQSNAQFLNAFQIDGKIRLVVIKYDYFQGIYQAAISCANLTKNFTTNQYYFEYDQPHYAQSTSQIIEYLFIDSNNLLILATQIGYEVINISPQISQTATNSSQNMIYLFNSINKNNLFSHSKFLVNSQSIFYQISNEKIYLQLLNFKNQTFSNDTARKQIVLNSINYENFNVNFNQMQLIDNQTIVIAYKNQLQAITFPNKNSNQITLYSSFVDQNSDYYMNGIQKILYSSDSNFMAIIFNSGFRVYHLDSQKQMFEKNLRQKIINAEAVSQYITIVFQTNLYYNYLIFDADKSQMFQSDMPVTNIYITLIKQQTPQLLFVGIYYSNYLQLLCISSQKIDNFRVDASPQLTNYNYNTTIQVLNNNIYVSTIEFYILIFAYDLTNSLLTQIDNILTLDSFFVIDTSNTIVVSTCFDSNSYVVFNRVSRQNYLLLSQKLIPGQVDFLQIMQSRQYNQIVFSPPKTLLGSSRLTVFNLSTYKSQSINLPKIFSSCEQSFIANDGVQYYLFNQNNLTNSTISFPMSTTISPNYNNIYQIQNTSFVIISTALNVQYLFNIQNNMQATQKLLKASYENQLATVQSNQIVLYSSQSLISQYVFSPTNLYLPDINMQSSSYQSANQAEVIAIYPASAIFIDLNINEYLNISVSQSTFQIKSNTTLIGKRQLLTTTQSDQQYAVVDIQLNIINIFVNQTRVVYIPEIDSFISANQNREVLLQKRSDYKIQKTNLTLIEDDSQLKCQAVIKSRNTILIRTTSQSQSYLYLFNYYTYSVNQLYFQDSSYFQSEQGSKQLIAQDNYIIIFLQFSFTLIEVNDNSQYRTISYQKYTPQFSKYYNWQYIFYDSFANLMIQYSLLQQVFQVFDFNQNLTCQQFFSSSVQSYHALQDKKFIIVTQQSLNIVNYMNCTLQTAPLQGIQFQQISGRNYPAFIILDSDLDTVVVVSQNRLNMFQYSTALYLGSLDYNLYTPQSYVYYVPSTNSLAVFLTTQFQLFDLWTPLFTNLHQNALKAYRSHFIYNQDSNTVLRFDYNSAVLNIYNSNNYQIQGQFKFNNSLFATQYFTQFYKIKYSTILAITSNRELVIYDFISNKQIKYLSSSFNCLLFSNFSQDIYCLEKNNILKKFNYILLDFLVIADSTLIQFQVNQFYALSSQVIVFISNQGSLALFNPITLQISSTKAIQQKINKIQLVGQYIIAQSQKQYLVVFYIDSKQGLQNVTQIFQFYGSESNNVLDFDVIQYSNSYTLVIATSLSLQVINMQTNQFICNLPTACQSRLQIKQDEQYFYIICSFQVSVFQKRVLKLVNYYKVNQFKFSNVKDIILVYQDMFLVILQQGMHLIQLNKQQSNLLESFSNLFNPRVYQIQFAYSDKQQQTLSEIIFKYYSDSNLFNISYPLSSNNFQTNQILTLFTQSPYSNKNIHQHSDLQSRVYNQNLKLAKYQIQMNIQNSNLIEIQKFYDVFTEDTIIEYSFSMQQGQKGLANIIDNNFILPLFCQLSFQTISLQLALNQSDFNLNPYSNLKTTKFSDIELIFNGNSNSPLLIDNLNLLVLDKMIIQNQLLNQLHSNIKIANVTTVLIINMTIQNIQVLNQPLFIFQSVNNITFQNLNLEGVSLNSTLFQFIECQNIQIQDTSVNNLKILQGNIIQVIKNNLIQVFNFNASQIYQVAQLQRITNLQDQQRILQNQLIEVPSILNLKGCQIVSIQNVNLYNIQDVSFVQVNHYSIGYQLQYFSNQISIQNINVQELDYSKHGNYIFSITSIDANLINFKFVNVTSSNSLISLNVQLQVLIQDSQFEEVNLLTGSVFSVQQFQLNLNQSQFTNINCSGLPCALNVISADLVSIQNSIFTNLNNRENNQGKNNQLANYKGGAIKILSTNSTIINNSLFYNCSSLEEGGAIYIQQQQQGISIIQMSNFTENESKQNSGGALYLSELSQVNIVQSNFIENQAIRQKGGAIYLDKCTLQQFKQNNFTGNTADIGGAIYYYKTDNLLLSQNILLDNQNYFSKNKGTFYGKNIGSVPFWIGISEKPYISSLSIVEEFSINRIASGNYLQKPLYINFIDEENNPLNFLGSDTLQDRRQFFFELYFQNNSQIIIQEGIYPQLNKSIGLFQLNFQSIYKISQNQTIYLTSNEFLAGGYLSVPIKLNFRNCQIGEIIQEKDQFIQCNQCVQGVYSLKVPDMKDDINQLQCFSCPKEAYFCQGSEIKLKDGYWRENNQTDLIYKCILDSCSYDNLKSKYGCLPGFMGPLCNSCDGKRSIWNEQYGFKNNYCYVCKSSLENFGYLCFFILFFFFYIFYSQQNIVNNQIKNIKLKIFKQIELLVTSKLSSSGNDTSLQFKIFIHYLQILSCLIQFGVFTSNILIIPLNVFGDPISITTYSLDCLFNIDDKYPMWLNRIISQIFSIFIISLLSVISILFINLKQYKNYKETFRKLPQKSKMIQIYIYILYQPSISKILIQSLMCTKIGEKYYLLSDYSQQCYDYYHKMYSLAIIFPLIIIWCFLIPLKLYYKLKSFQLLDQHNHQISQKVENLLTYGILYNGYKNQFLYWEIIKIAHKLFLMVIINLGIDDNIKLTIILSSIILYMHELYQKQPHQNQIQFQQEKSITLKLLYSFQLILIVVNDFTESKILSMISVILIIIINISSIEFIFLIIFGQISLKFDQNKSFTNQIKNLLLKIKQRYPNVLQQFQFRQVKIIRIHQLWKKVILAYRKNNFNQSIRYSQSYFTKTKFLSNKINQNTTDYLFQNQENQLIRSVNTSDVFMNVKGVQKNIFSTNLTHYSKFYQQAEQESKAESPQIQLEESDYIQDNQINKIQMLPAEINFVSLKCVSKHQEKKNIFSFEIK